MSDSEEEPSDASGSQDSASTSSSAASELGKRSLNGSAKSLHVNQNRHFDLASRIHDRLCIDERTSMAVKSHRSAVKAMVELRDVLMRMTSDPGRDTRLLLLYAGISINRRINLGAEGTEAEDFGVTVALLFMLQVLCDNCSRASMSASGHSSPLATGDAGQAMSPSLVQNAAPSGQEEQPTEAVADKGEEGDPEAPPTIVRNPDEETLDRWRMTTLWERTQEAAMDDGEWAQILRPSPEGACRACVVQGSRLGEAGNLARVSALAQTFFRCSTLSLQYNMLLACETVESADRSFLTLSSVDLLTEANDDMQKQRLANIVDSGESEAGQQVLRDLILSFTLPQSVVGVRRTPLLSREANRIATEQYTTELGNAHEAAMRGAEWSWKEDKEEVHQMCALLSGLCILFAGRGGSADIIRKNDAFMGRVQLPFFETQMPAPGLKLLGFIPHRNEWLVYKINKKQKVEVLLRDYGLEGLCQAALLVTSDLQSR